MSREMKDSGVEWIGEIPEDWKSATCKKMHLFEKKIRKHIKKIQVVLSLSKGKGVKST